MIIRYIKENDNIRIYINGEKTNMYVHRTCYASYQIYRDDIIISEQYSMDQVTNKIKEIFNSR